MNNKNCGCQSAGYSFDGGCGNGFVPVNGNWDFGMGDCACQRQRRNRSNTCQAQKEARNSGSCQRQETSCQEKQRSQRNACTGMADCPCDSCMRRREAERSACNANGRKAACTGTADCTCDACMRRRQTECEPCARQKKQADNRGVGIVWAKKQELDAIYDADHALKAGTLYPELHKPMNGYWPCGENCADCAQEAAFMIWELRLYLNTHPCDKEALALFRQLREKAEGTYAEAFLPEDCTRWAWTDDPWPWEYDCACNK